MCICAYLTYSCSSQLLFSNASCSSIANYLTQWSIQTFPIHPHYLQTQSLKAIPHATLLKWWGPEETEYAISVPLFFQIRGNRVVWHCFLFRGIFFNIYSTHSFTNGPFSFRPLPPQIPVPLQLLDNHQIFIPFFPFSLINKQVNLITTVIKGNKSTWPYIPLQFPCYFFL